MASVLGTSVVGIRFLVVITKIGVVLEISFSVVADTGVVEIGISVVTTGFVLEAYVVIILDVVSGVIVVTGLGEIISLRYRQI